MIKIPGNFTETLGKFLVNFQKRSETKKNLINFRVILTTIMKNFAKIMKIFAKYKRKKFLSPFNKKK